MTPAEMTAARTLARGLAHDVAGEPVAVVVIPAEQWEEVLGLVRALAPLLPLLSKFTGRGAGAVGALQALRNAKTTDRP